MAFKINSLSLPMIVIFECSLQHPKFTKQVFDLRGAALPQTFQTLRGTQRSRIADSGATGTPFVAQSLATFQSLVECSKGLAHVMEGCGVELTLPLLGSQ